MRIDIGVTSFNFNKIDTLTFPRLDFENPADGYLSDVGAYGPAELMQKYCTMCDHMEDMYAQDQVNLSHADKLLRDYIKKRCNITPVIDPGFTYTHW